MKTGVWLMCVAVTAISASASPASAQSAGWSVTAGYQMLRLTDNWVPLGFNFDVAREQSERWSIVGEFGIAHNDADEDDPHSFNIATFGGGVRLSGARGRATPFAQLLAGVEITSSDTDTDGVFMLQPGAGVHVPLSDRWGAVGQIDFRAAFFREEVDPQWRFVIAARWSSP